MRLFALYCFLVLFVLDHSALSAQAGPVKIVAAENFYGGVATQIAGDSATVTSILSNPNQDPHDFTVNASTARAIADADIVIYNGLGYDSWMEKLLATPGKKDRVVICLASMIRTKDGDNPHLWYQPLLVSALANEVAVQLSVKTKTPVEKDKPGVFVKRALDFQQSVVKVMTKASLLRVKTDGIKVTATEPVFGYMCETLGFRMLNYDFQVRVMNDTEPSASQTAAFEKSLRTRTARLLFYNSQVTDPTTERLKKLAQQCGVPIVGVTETQPADQKTYADWMTHELDAVEAGLAAAPPLK